MPMVAAVKHQMDLPARLCWLLMLNKTGLEQLTGDVLSKQGNWGDHSIEGAMTAR